MLKKQEKEKIIDDFETHESDTGSPEVQVAILTKRINDLTEHLKTPVLACVNNKSIRVRITCPAQISVSQGNLIA